MLEIYKFNISINFVKTNWQSLFEIINFLFTK
jgi:hypothetical protein